MYRPDGSIEHMQTLEKSELDRLQGVEMYLPQGNYTVVLWANASDAQTKLGGFSEGETIRNLSASHPHKFEDGCIVSHTVFGFGIL